MGVPAPSKAPRTRRSEALRCGINPIRAAYPLHGPRPTMVKADRHRRTRRWSWLLAGLGIVVLVLLLVSFRYAYVPGAEMSLNESPRRPYPRQDLWGVASPAPALS